MIEQLSEDAVFRVAYGIESPELRDEYLRQISLGDPALYHRVAALLEASREEPDFLESPAAGVGVTVDFEPIAERPGTQIGPYKLLEEIGQGGMGVVYMAAQTGAGSPQSRPEDHQAGDGHQGGDRPV